MDIQDMVSFHWRCSIISASNHIHAHMTMSEEIRVRANNGGVGCYLYSFSKTEKYFF